MLKFLKVRIDPNNFSLRNKCIQTWKGRTAVCHSTLARDLLSGANLQRCLRCIKQKQKLTVSPKDMTESLSLAAVLITVCVDQHNDQTSILYTKRSDRLSRHGSQISFPGGIKEPNDVTLVDCALRETEEEVGLPSDRIQVWGSGSLLHHPRSQLTIAPIYGTVYDFNFDELLINTDEVEEAFTAPISLLISKNSLGYKEMEEGYRLPVFMVGKHKIWGITAWLTYQFLNCFVPDFTINLKRLTEEKKID